MKLHIPLLALAFMLTIPSFSQAQSLKERQFRAEQEKELTSEAASASSTCGSPIVAKMDWAGFKSEDGEKYSVSSYCDHVLGAIEGICGDEEGKKAVQEKIKNVVCKFGGSREIKLENGTVTYTIEFEAANNEDFVKDYLMNNL